MVWDQLQSDLESTCLWFGISWSGRRVSVVWDQLQSDLEGACLWFGTSYNLIWKARVCGLGPATIWSGRHVSVVWYQLQSDLDGAFLGFVFNASSLIWPKTKSMVPNFTLFSICAFLERSKLWDEKCVCRPRDKNKYYYISEQKHPIKKTDSPLCRSTCVVISQIQLLLLLWYQSISLTCFGELSGNSWSCHCHYTSLDTETKTYKCKVIYYYIDFT